MKAVIAGKAWGIFTGIIYLIKMVFITQELVFKVIFAANILLADIISILFIIYLTKKYFNNLSRE